MSVQIWSDPDHSWTDGTETFSAPRGWVSRLVGGDDGDSYMLVVPPETRDARDIAATLRRLDGSPFAKVGLALDPEMGAAWDADRAAIGDTPIPLTLRDVLALHDAHPDRYGAGQTHLRWTSLRRDMARFADDAWSPEVAERLATYFRRPIAPGESFSIGHHAAEEGVPRILRETSGSLDRALAALRTFGAAVRSAYVLSEADRVASFVPPPPMRQIEMDFSAPLHSDISAPAVAVEWGGEVHVAASMDAGIHGVIEFPGAGMRGPRLRTTVRVPASATAWVLDRSGRISLHSPGEPAARESESHKRWRTWRDSHVREDVVRALLPRVAERLDDVLKSCPCMCASGRLAVNCHGERYADYAALPALRVRGRS